MANAELDQGGYSFYFIPAGNGSDEDDDDDNDKGNMSDGGKEAASPKSPTPAGPSGQVAT